MFGSGLGAHQVARTLMTRISTRARDGQSSTQRGFQSVGNRHNTHHPSGSPLLSLLAHPLVRHPRAMVNRLVHRQPRGRGLFAATDQWLDVVALRRQWSVNERSSWRGRQVNAHDFVPSRSRRGQLKPGSWCEKPLWYCRQNMRRSR